MMPKTKNKTKIKIKTMDQLHHHLSNKSSWYAAWHKEPTAQTFHWFAFGVIVLFAGVLLVNAVNPFLSGLSSHAAANDPARVLVVYNAAYTGDEDHDGTQDSLQVANYYMQKRGVPSANLLGISPTDDSTITGFTNLQSQILTPIKNKLSTLGPTNIDVILFTYHTPYKYGSISLDNAVMGLNAWTSTVNKSGNPYFEPNPTFSTDKGHFDHNFKFSGTNMYLVGRLDGPGGVIRMMNLVDEALYAERYLSAQPGYYQGNVYVDSQNRASAEPYTDAFLSANSDVQQGNYGNYNGADVNIAYGSHYVANSGLTLKWQKMGDIIGTAGTAYQDGTSAETAPNALFYGGWYAATTYLEDVWQWLPGSVSNDLDSYGFAYSLRSTHYPQFAGQSIAHGASAATGAVLEPYVDGTSRPNIMLYYLFNGYSFAEATALSNTYLGWAVLNVGDPLYTPFKPKTAVMDTQSPAFAPGYPRLYQSMADGNVIDVMANDSPEPEVMKVTVNYGTTASYGATYTSPFYQRRQTFALTDVQGGVTLHYKITMTDPAGNSTSSGDLTMVTPAQTPYGGTAWAVPGTIEFENFDLGGEGVAYHDSEPTNYNPTYQFRNETGVETLADQGITRVWFVYPKEYLEYTVNVAQSGNYTFTETSYLNSPQTSEGGRFHIEVDGVNKTGSVHIPGAATASWTTFTQTGISLPAGQHVIRFYMELGSNNDGQTFGSLTPLDKFSVVYTGAGTGDTTAPTVSMTAPTAGQTLSGSVTVSANASDNVGVAGVQFKVDNNNIGTEDTTAPYSMAWSSSAVADGAHQISAVARDAAGNVSNATPVNVTVSNTQSPVYLNLSPTSLSFVSVSGGATPAAKSITLSNPSSSGGENWSANTNQSWCHVAPTSGSLSANSSVNLTVSVDAPSNVGTFNCTLTVSSAEAANSPQTANIIYDVTAAPPSGTLSAQDIGSVALSGSTTEAGGTYTVKASGIDIWDPADAFRYSYQPLAGDGTVIARVNSVVYTDDFALAGVMIRESFAADSKHAAMLVSPSGRAKFRSRAATSGSTVSVGPGAGGITLPQWTKVVRQGNNFSGYISVDGSSWQLIASATVAMGSNVYAGIAVTSHNNTVLTTAVVDQYSLSTSAPPPPTLSHLNLSSTSAAFSAVSGEATPAAKTVNVNNSGSAASSWTSSASQSWCHLTPVSGALAIGGSATLSVSVDAPSNVGTFSCTISITDVNADNSPQNINVSYTVTSATPSATPVITSYSVSASVNSATITWTTDQPTTGVIKYGSANNNLNLSVADAVLSTTHSKTITGLASKSAYYYQITATNASSGSTTTVVSSFRTKPK